MKIADIDVSFVYRERRFYKNGWQCWYEECPIISHTARFIIVSSKTYPDSPLYAGGMFYLNREKMIRERKCYHSRYGEYFYLEKPSQGFLFPSQDVMNSLDPLLSELEYLGWERYNLTQDQLRIYVVSSILKTNISSVMNSGIWREFYK